MSPGLRPPDELHTERLRLRRPELGDAPVMFNRWAQDPDVTRYLVWTPHVSIHDSEAHIERCQHAWQTGEAYVWFIEERLSGSVIGSIAARDQSHGINLGYLLARDCWGKGYMAEAVRVVTSWFLSRPGVARVWATCDIENAPSARVLEKAGFKLEGILRRWDIHPNVSTLPRDAMCFSRVRE